MPQVPPLSGSPGLIAAVDEAFADLGPLARAIPQFEPREAQREMAGLVADTLANGGVLLAEAGTGTGKTLAYLVPAILQRQRVLISTGTKNLQEQIYFKDLPVLREALGVPFTATYMKGRGNYLCLHRFDSLLEGHPDVGRRNDAAEAMPLPLYRSQPPEAATLLRIAEWAAQTGSGDRAEITDLPEDLPFWNEISASSENCVGTECPRYLDCFITRMRQRAAESDLVIVNHHLLCADAAVRQSAYGEVIPAFNYAILDEAHQLEDVATQYFGISVSTYRIEELARDAERLIAARVVEDRRGELVRAIDRIRERSRLFFSGLRGAPDRGTQPPRGDERARLTPQRMASHVEAGQMLAGALENLEATVNLLKAPADDLDAGAAAPAHEDLPALARRSAALRDELRFVLRMSDPDYVYYLEVRGRGVFLRAAPIDVSKIMRELLLDRLHATVLTSATLTVEGSFEYLRGRLGVEHAQELRVPSGFDYRRQTILYLPRQMPDPRSPQFADQAGREIVEILRRTEGRAFALFTSYAVLRTVETIARRALAYPILVQGTAPRTELLERFRNTPNAVLLATSSFWQGVDVMGEALSCVIIDKLPFASPGDPITAARMEAITARGGDPFSTFQVPLAILALLQGLGRLIRHRQDRGVLAILDPRLRTMAYGRRFLEALPPAPLTQDLEDIDAFLEH